MITIFGLISNFLILLTLSKKKLIKNPNNTFLIAISMRGLIALVCYCNLFIADELSDHFPYLWMFVWASTLPICYLVCAVQTWSTVSLASWHVTTLDFPQQNSIKITRKRATMNLIVISIIVIISHLPHYLNYHIDTMKYPSRNRSFSFIGVMASVGKVKLMESPQKLENISNSM